METVVKEEVTLNKEQIDTEWVVISPSKIDEVIVPFIDSSITETTTQNSLLPLEDIHSSKLDSNSNSEIVDETLQLGTVGKELQTFITHEDEISFGLSLNDRDNTIENDMKTGDNDDDELTRNSENLEERTDSTKIERNEGKVDNIELPVDNRLDLEEVENVVGDKKTSDNHTPLVKSSSTGTTYNIKDTGPR